MIHQVLTDEDRERASLFALDALSPDEAGAFARHLADGCTVCRAEVDALSAVAGDLAMGFPPKTPPPALRARVLDAAAAEPAGRMAVIRSHEGNWIEISPGVCRKDLTLAPGGSVFLIRVAPGARVMTHTHALPEHCYVVEGDARVAGERLGPGDHHIAGAGSVHDGLWSEGGCVLLIADVPA